MKIGSSVEVFYSGNTTKATVRDLEVFKRPTPDLIAGDRGGAFLKMKVDLSARRGAVIYTPSDGNIVSKDWTVRNAFEDEEAFALEESKSSPVYCGTASEGNCGVEVTGEGEGVLRMRGGGMMAKRGDPIVVMMVLEVLCLASTRFAAKLRLPKV